MKKTKRVKYNVQCAINKEHIFEYVFTILEGSEARESEVEAFCPDCDDFVRVTIKGTIPKDKPIFRFNG